MMDKQRFTTKRKGFILLALALIFMIGIGVGVWKIRQTGQLTAAQATAVASGTYKASAVRRGSIALNISGTGQVVTAQSVDLSFATSGVLSELNVAIGDQVTKGQVLARLGNMDQLTLKVQNQQVAIQTAQKTLDDLQANAALNLAQAQVDQASAQAAYEEAKTNLHLKGDPRCVKSKTETYYWQYLLSKEEADVWENRLVDGTSGYGHDYILDQLKPLRQKRDAAYLNWKYCEGYTEQEILNSQATLEVAKATLDRATQTYQTLQASSGVKTQEIEIAQATLKNEQLQLTTAQENLDAATITAPMDGIVTAVNGVVGYSAGKRTLITLADMANPKVQVNIDETDLQNFAVGCAAQVTFTSLPNQTFPGVVTQVSPSLVTVQSVGVVQGLVDLEKKKTLSGKSLSLGLTASVEVTCQQAENALLVSAQALYDQATQTPYVYVLNAQGKPEKREVSVGIVTVASAEILNGLQEGEQVITNQIQASN
jgi:HlyD family secretion protein